MYNLGTLFEEQLRDFGKACAWYRKADDAGDKKAKKALAKVKAIFKERAISR